MVVRVFTARRARIITAAVHLPIAAYRTYYSRCATRNQSGRRRTSFGRVGIRHHRAQTPRRVLSPRTNRATTDRAGSRVAATSAPTTLRWGPTRRTPPGEDVVIRDATRPVRTTAWISIDRYRFIARENPLTDRHTYTQSNPTTTSNRISHLFTRCCILYSSPSEHVFFTWLHVTSSCTDFVFTILSTNSSFEYFYPRPIDCVRLLLIRCLRAHLQTIGGVLNLQHTRNIANVLSKFVVCIINIVSVDTHACPTPVY